MLLKSVSLLDVLARWGYSEIVDSNTERHYDNGRDIAGLRAKRQSGVPFEDLSPEERYNLAFQSGWVRNALVVYTIGAELFDVVDIDHSILAKFVVPPNVWHPASQGQFVPFEHFMTTTSPNPRDSRNATLRASYYQQQPPDPLTIGRLYDQPILLDGYHRAAAFWKFGPADGTIKTYVPQALVAAFTK